MPTAAKLTFQTGEEGMGERTMMIAMQLKQHRRRRKKKEKPEKQFAGYFTALSLLSTSINSIAICADIVHFL